MNGLPSEFVANITEFFPNGEAWLAELPASLAAAAEQWSLTIGAMLPNLSFNYVCFVTQGNGDPAVLKLCVPRVEVAREAAALRLYGGRHAARLIAADEEKGWLLLERITPGTPLSALADDEEATRILAATVQNIHAPPPESSVFRPLSEWGAGFAKLRRRYGGGTGPFPGALVARGEEVFARDVASPVLLHADFHHDNVLRCGASEWVIIDPQGMVGDGLYDVGALLYNPFALIRSHPNLRVLLARRIAILTEMLDVERDAIIDWGIAQAMLSSWWTMEERPDGAELPVEVRVAEVLATL